MGETADAEAGSGITAPSVSWGESWEPDETELRERSGAKWRCTPAGTLPVWVADMDFAVAPPIRDRLCRLGQHDLGYPDWPDGVTPLREAFAERMAKRYGWSPNPAEVREFTDVTQAVQLMLHLATEPGDGVAVHTPGFGPFLASIRRMGRRVVPIPMVDTGEGWTFDPERLCHDLTRTRSTALLLVNPHNPTGRVFTRAELNRLAQIADRYGLLVISDEIHADLTYEPYAHVSFAALGDTVRDRTVTITSATKAFNLAGVRCAAGHIGPRWLRDSVAARPMNLYGSVSVFGVAATLAAWTESDGWLADTVAYLARNRRLVAETLAAHAPAIRHHVPEATYLSWLDCRALGWSDPAAVFRDRAQVHLSAGPDFNPGGDGFVRLNFATYQGVLCRVLDRLTQCVHADAEAAPC